MFTEEQIKQAYIQVHADQFTPDSVRDKLWGMCDENGKRVFRRFAEALGKMIEPVRHAPAEPEDKPKRHYRKKAVLDVSASS